MTSSPPLIVSVESLCPLASLIVIVELVVARRACCLERRGSRGVVEALLYDGKSNGGVKLIVGIASSLLVTGLLLVMSRGRVGEARRGSAGLMVLWFHL